MTIELGAILLFGITVISLMTGWIWRIINKKNNIIAGLKKEKNENINEFEKEFQNHVKESGIIKNENFTIMEKKVAVLEEKVGNIGENLDEFKKETKHNFEAIFFKIDKIFENQNSMSKDVVALTEAVKSLRNGK